VHLTRRAVQTTRSRCRRIRVVVACPNIPARRQTYTQVGRRRGTAAPTVFRTSDVGGFQRGVTRRKRAPMPRTPPLSRPAPNPRAYPGSPRAPRRLREAWSWRFSPRYGGSPRACVRGPRSRRSVLALQLDQLVGRTIAGSSSSRAPLEARNKNACRLACADDGNTVEEFERGRRGVRKVRAWCRDRGVVTEAARKEVRRGNDVGGGIVGRQDAGRPDRVATARP